MCIGSNSVNQAQDLMFVTKFEDFPNSLLPILQASVCVSEECTLRGEVADLLAPVIQTMALQQQQQLIMAASLGPGHAQAVARAGTLKPPTYCWMMRRERKNDFFYHFAGFTAVF